MRFFINLLLPLTMIFGKIFGASSEGVLRTLIGWNNRLVVGKIREKKGLLLLVPICLQSSVCEVKISENARNCRRCGECNVKELAEFSERHGIDLAIVTGGRLAKELVELKKPPAVIAIACEKELASGIFETYPLPVFGIIIERPKGPCKDTRVDMKIVYQAIGVRDEPC